MAPDGRMNAVDQSPVLIYSLPPLAFFAGAAMLAGGIRLLFFGNGKIRRAVGALFGGVFLGGIFGSATHRICSTHDRMSAVCLETGLLTTLIVAILTPIALELILSVGTRSLHPLGDGVVGAAKWWSRRIGGGDTTVPAAVNPVGISMELTTTTTTPEPNTPSIVVQGK